MTGSRAAAIAYRLVGLSRCQHLARVTLQKVAEKALAASRHRVSMNGKPAIAGIHKEQHMLGRYQISTAREFVPADQRRQVSGIAVVRNQKPSFASPRQRMPVPRKEEEDAVVARDVIASKAHEGLKDTGLSGVAIPQDHHAGSRKVEFADEALSDGLGVVYRESERTNARISINADNKRVAAGVSPIVEFIDAHRCARSRAMNVVDSSRMLITFTNPARYDTIVLFVTGQKYLHERY
jgi:hypothetical protein